MQKKEEAENPLKSKRNSNQIKKMNKFHILSVIIMASFLIFACHNKSSDKVKSQDVKSVPESQKSEVRIKAELPFEAYIKLKIPEGAKSRVPEGVWDPSAAIFDPPIHPLGTIDTLKLYNKVIPLKIKELKEGIISTNDFGEIEIFLTGISNGGAILEYRAFPSDIEKLKKSYPVSK